MRLIRTKEDFIVAQLNELIDGRKSLMDNDPEHDEIYTKDVQALESAIWAVKNCAPIEHGTWTAKEHSRMKWIPKESDGINEDKIAFEDMTEQKCSICQRWTIKYTHRIELNFCPYCGARMDGDTNA